MTPLQYLEALYSFLLNPEDARYVPEASMNTLLEIAEGYRPRCLSLPLQNEAVAHYAAYLAESEYIVRTGDYSSRQPRRREREGDVEIEYQEYRSVADGGVPFTNTSAYEKWKALARRCRGGILISGGPILG